MVTRTKTWKRISTATATGTHMRISTMDTAMPMATGILTRASGTGMPTATTTDIHMRICTMAIAMAIPRRIASTTAIEDTDMLTNIATEPRGRPSNTTWTLSPSGPM